MKTLSATILLVLSLGLLHQAAAQPFNERGPLWQDVAPAGSEKPRRPVRPELSQFKERDMLWSQAAPVGIDRPRQPVKPDISGFNRRAAVDLR